MLREALWHVMLGVCNAGALGRLPWKAVLLAVLVLCLEAAAFAQKDGRYTKTWTGACICRVHTLRTALVWSR
jgi:hypothetical protein